jgi:hypothetical protein
MPGLTTFAMASGTWQPGRAVSGRQSLTPLCAAGFDDGAATASRHAGSKAMVPGALQAAWLKSTLHFSFLSRGSYASGHTPFGKLKMTDTRGEL